MKRKSVLTATLIFCLTFGLGACGSSAEVTADEWKKNFSALTNFTLEMRVPDWSFHETRAVVYKMDGDIIELEELNKDGTVTQFRGIMTKEDERYYTYIQGRDGEWRRESFRKSSYDENVAAINVPSDILIDRYDLFLFENGNYVCDTFTIQAERTVTVENAVVSFANKTIAEVTLTVENEDTIEWKNVFYSYKITKIGSTKIELPSEYVDTVITY